MEGILIYKHNLFLGTPKFCILLVLLIVCLLIRDKWDDNSPPSGAYKGTRGGKAICFSACEDYQLAADTTVSASSFFRFSLSALNYFLFI